jgi:hypothetical protein
MNIPLVAFLYLYLLFVLVWLIFSLIALYHILRYGQISFTSFLAIFMYVAVSVILLFLAFEYLSQIDWSVNLTIFKIAPGPFGANDF